MNKDVSQHCPNRRYRHHCMPTPRQTHRFRARAKQKISISRVNAPWMLLVRLFGFCICDELHPFLVASLHQRNIMPSSHLRHRQVYQHRAEFNQEVQLAHHGCKGTVLSTILCSDIQFTATSNENISHDASLHCLPNTDEVSTTATNNSYVTGILFIAATKMLS